MDAIHTLMMRKLNLLRENNSIENKVKVVGKSTAMESNFAWMLKCSVNVGLIKDSKIHLDI